MPKTIRNIFYKKFKFELLIEAHKRASKSKRCHKEVILFEMDLESNIATLMKEIKNKTYKVGKYREFIIREPKERLIKSLPYRDRVIHQWYIEEFIKPYIVPRLIKDTYACIEERGNHKAVLKLQKYMRIMKQNYGEYYVLKCDIKKFFYNIDKYVLYSILNKYISDKDLLEFTKVLVWTGDDESVGIPIGNYTSQYFANIYLNELDQYVKNELRVRYYIRYMDDFVLLVENKEKAKYLKNKIGEFLKERLKLSLNDKTNYFPNKKGVDFCGYVVYETHILVRKRCKKDMLKKIKRWNYKYLNKNIDYKKVQASFASWIAHCSHAHSYNLVRKYSEKLIFKI